MPVHEAVKEEPNARSNETRGGEETRGEETRGEETRNEESPKVGTVEAGEPSNKGNFDAFEMKTNLTPESVKAFESNIKGEPLEHGQFFDANGNPLSDVIVGTESSIDISSGENVAGDSIFTHNHPNNGIFSPADLTTATNYNMAEMRAVM